MQKGDKGSSKLSTNSCIIHIHCISFLKEKKAQVLEKKVEEGFSSKKGLLSTP